MPLALKSSGGGSVTIDVPSTASNFTQTLLAASGTLAPIVQGTAQNSTSGTAIDFTSLPSWVKRVTMMFNGVSGSGTSTLLAQLGTSSGITNTGYFSVYEGINVAGTNSSNASTAVGFGLVLMSAATDLVYGQVTFTNMTGNIWVASSITARDSSSDAIYYAGGNVTLAGTLDRVRLTWLNGTDTFDAGSVNIMYEG